MIGKIFQLVLTASLLPIAVSSGIGQQGDENITPREYCQQTGGKVTETGYQAVYICCYRVEKKCIVSNVAQGYSRIIPLGSSRLAYSFKHSE